MKKCARNMGCVGLALVACLASVMVEAQTGDGKVEFTAFAVNLNATGRAASGTVQIVVKRWSTDAERDQLMAAFQQSGSDKQLAALQKLPRIGYIRTPDSIGYELHYARQTADADGGRRVFIATDRPIGFWEASRRPRTIDYPFTFIEMHLGHGRPGEGKMSIATKVTVDGERNVIELENYSAQPVLLQSVQERKK